MPWITLGILVARYLWGLAVVARIREGQCCARRLREDVSDEGEEDERVVRLLADDPKRKMFSIYRIQTAQHIREMPVK